MSTPAIRVENLGKKYRIRHQQEGRRYKSLRDVLAGKATAVFNRSAAAQPATEDFWALRDVSFEIEQGEAVGIIGRNGAGKSTLLKLLSRITEPTSGRMELEGRVSSLLEVGTGFHPELTGRENIYLNGAVLGMSRAEIKKNFDPIVAFAEVERFLDTPVKRYSSGMYMRLAFSVAAHLEPEILIVDEVLAVGDATFQRKCLGRMREVSTQGRTVLFVSHNMGAITTLCRSAILLNAGRVASKGPVREVADQYLTVNVDTDQNILALADLKRNGDLGRSLRIERLEWLTNIPLQHGEDFKARIYYRITQDVDEATFGIGFSTLEGVRLLTYETDFQDGHRPDMKKGSTGYVDVAVRDLPLAPGLYAMDIGSRSGDHFALDYLPGFSRVEIVMGPKTPGTIVRQGAGVRLPSEWQWNSGAVL